jgi:hypothetical protein
MDLDEQLVHFDRLSELAYERTLQAFADERKKILREARKRLIANYGLYGDAGWYHTPIQHHHDRLEEFADSLNYTIMELRGYGL